MGRPPEAQGIRVILYRLEFGNAKSYIGITARTARARYREHELDAREGRAAVHCAWRKHGAPTMDVIATFTTKAELLDAERAAILQHGTRAPSGYNMTPGGDANPMDVPEIARRSGEKNRGRKHTAEARSNMGAARRGKTLAAAHRTNISAGQMGRVHPPETLDKIRARAIGRRAADSVRAKLSAQRKGVPHGPMSEETKRKLSDTRKAYWDRMRREDPEALQVIIAKSARGIERAWARRRTA